MKIIMEVYGILLMLLLTSAAGISVTAAQERVAQAKQYQAEVIAEIENSNFNEHVIDACVKGAKESGYELTVLPETYDAEHDIKTAQVVLSYTYKIPLFGIEQTRTTRGVAR